MLPAGPNPRKHLPTRPQLCLLSCLHPAVQEGGPLPGRIRPVRGRPGGAATRAGAQQPSATAAAATRETGKYGDKELNYGR